MMAGIKGRDTKLEPVVRRIAHRLGLRFRQYRKTSPAASASSSCAAARRYSCTVVPGIGTMDGGAATRRTCRSRERRPDQGRCGVPSHGAPGRVEVAVDATRARQGLGRSDDRNRPAVERNAGFVSINESSPDFPVPRQVEEQLDRLCLAALDEQFEVGVESRFSKELQRLCAYHPIGVLRSLRARLLHGGASPEVLSEILQWASRQEAGAIRPIVVELLSTGLHHKSSLVRDAAASALACLDERAAVSHLRQAIERETAPELRGDLEDLVRSLES